MRDIRALKSSTSELCLSLWPLLEESYSYEPKQISLPSPTLPDGEHRGYTRLLRALALALLPLLVLHSLMDVNIVPLSNSALEQWMLRGVGQMHPTDQNSHFTLMKNLVQDNLLGQCSRWVNECKVAESWSCEGPGGRQCSCDKERCDIIVQQHHVAHWIRFEIFPTGGKQQRIDNCSLVRGEDNSHFHTMGWGNRPQTRNVRLPCTRLTTAAEMERVMREAYGMKGTGIDSLGSLHHNAALSRYQINVPVSDYARTNDMDNVQKLFKFAKEGNLNDHALSLVVKFYSEVSRKFTQVILTSHPVNKIHGAGVYMFKSICSFVDIGALEENRVLVNILLPAHLILALFLLLSDVLDDAVHLNRKRQSIAKQLIHNLCTFWKILDLLYLIHVFDVNLLWFSGKPGEDTMTHKWQNWQHWQKIQNWQTGENWQTGVPSVHYDMSLRLSLMCFVAAFRVLSFFRFHPGLSIVTSSFRIDANDLFDVIVILLIQLNILGLALFLGLGLGGSNPDFLTIGEAVNNTALLAFGFYDFQKLNTRGLGWTLSLEKGNFPMATYIVYWLLIFYVYIFVPNILLSVIVDAYEQARDELDREATKPRQPALWVVFRKSMAAFRHTLRWFSKLLLMRRGSVRATKCEREQDLVNDGWVPPVALNETRGAKSGERNRREESSSIEELRYAFVSGSIGQSLFEALRLPGADHGDWTALRDDEGLMDQLMDGTELYEGDEAAQWRDLLFVDTWQLAGFIHRKLDMISKRAVRRYLHGSKPSDWQEWLSERRLLPEQVLSRSNDEGGAALRHFALPAHTKTWESLVVLVAGAAASSSESPSSTGLKALWKTVYRPLSGQERYFTAMRLLEEIFSAYRQGSERLVRDRQFGHQSGGGNHVRKTVQNVIGPRLNEMEERLTNLQDQIAAISTRLDHESLVAAFKEALASTSTTSATPAI